MAFHLLGNSPSFFRTYGIKVKSFRSTKMILYYINIRQQAVLRQPSFRISDLHWGQILAKVLPDKIVFHLVDTNYSGSQCSFRASRRTIDKIFAPRQFKRMLESRTRTGIRFLFIRPKPFIQLIVICPL